MKKFIQKIFYWIVYNLLQILNLFFNRHPLFFAIIYLLLIPTYAFIYHDEPRSFYHSTSQYETLLFDVNELTYEL